MKKHHLICIAAYLPINLLFLTRFPFVHSDESWLAGLTRNMIHSGSLGVTETFFNLQPRYPHAIKSLFHILQMPFISVFGYDVLSVRLMSLCFGTISLVLFYKLLYLCLSNQHLAFWGTVLMAVDCQFLYMSRFARSEAIILTAMLSVCLLLLSDKKHAVVCAAILTGLSIGIHPNSFLVAAMGGAVLLTRGFRRGHSSDNSTRRKAVMLTLRELCVFVGVVGVFCAFFVALSLSFDPDFFRHYTAYGSQFEVNSSLYEKMREIIPYFQRLFYGVSGTYYTAEIRLQLILFPSMLVIGAFVAVFAKNIKLLIPIAAIIGILAGMTVIGRFSQPYVVFFFPFAYLLLMQLVSALDRWKKTVVIGVLCATLIFFSAAEFSAALKVPSYSVYVSQIAAHIPANGKTIGNLNSEFYFENGALLDYRNLTHLRGAELSFEEYVRQNDVEYLIISDELEFIYSRRPNWNGIYGNINFLVDMTNFIEQHCTLLHEFVDNQYGIRIVNYQNGDKDFTIRIYRVEST